MLIRSQDKRMIVNFDNICTVSAFPEKDSEDVYVEDGTGSLMIGNSLRNTQVIRNSRVNEIIENHIRQTIPTETSRFILRKTKSNFRN